jgi:GR25 family glycosyltransferase involved in LPS biosynthesis
MIDQLQRDDVAITNYSFVEAVDMVAESGVPSTDTKKVIELNKSLMDKGVVASNVIITRKRDYLWPGEIGLFLSWQKVLDIIIKKKYKMTLVLEDDCIFRPGFKKDFDKFYRSLQYYWDILSLSWTSCEQNTGHEVGDVLIPYASCHYEKTAGCHQKSESLVITLAAAKIIKKKLFPILAPFDKFLDILKNSCLVKIYIPVTSLTRQDDFPSDIQPETVKWRPN